MRDFKINTEDSMRFDNSVEGVVEQRMLGKLIREEDGNLVLAGDIFRHVPVGKKVYIIVFVEE